MCGGWVGDQIDDAVDFVTDDVFEDANDLLSGAGEILDDQLGFDPNGGGFVDVYNAVGMATVGLPVGSMGAQTSHGLQTLESGDFNTSEFWGPYAGNVIDGGLSYAAGGGFGESAQSGVNALNQLSGGVTGGDLGDISRSLIQGATGYPTAKNYGEFGASLGNLGVAAYNADQSRAAGADYLNYLNQARTQQQEATNQATGIIGGAYDQAMTYPEIIKNQQDQLLQDYTGTMTDVNQNRYDGLMGLLGDQRADLTSQARDTFGTQSQFLRDATGQATERFAPYEQGGAAAQNLLTQMLTGDGTQRYSEYLKTPGYEFAKNQGIGAIQNSLAAKGGLLSGAAMKEISDYTTGMASQNYNNYIGQLQTAASRGQDTAGSLAELDSKLGTNLSTAYGTMGGQVDDASRGYYTGSIAGMGDYQSGLQNIAATQFGQQGTNLSDYYGDLTSLGLGKATNQANLLTGNAANQTNLLGQLAQGQYDITRDTAAATQAGVAGGDLLGSILGNSSVQSGISDGLSWAVDGIGSLFGGGSSSSGGGFDSFDFGGSPGYAGGSSSGSDSLFSGFDFDFGSLF